MSHLGENKKFRPANCADYSGRKKPSVKPSHKPSQTIIMGARKGLISLLIGSGALMVFGGTNLTFATGVMAYNNRKQNEVIPSYQDRTSFISYAFLDVEVYEKFDAQPIECPPDKKFDLSDRIRQCIEWRPEANGMLIKDLRSPYPEHQNPHRPDTEDERRRLEQSQFFNRPVGIALTTLPIGIGILMMFGGFKIGSRRRELDNLLIY